MSALPFVVYDTTTGEIIKTGNCPVGVMALQAPGASHAVAMLAPGTLVSDATHFIDLSGPAPVLTLKEQA